MTATIAAEQIRLHAVDLIQSAVDPTTGGGVSAAIGSFLLRSTSGAAGAYLKTGATNTAWQKLAQSLAWKSVKDFGAAGDGVTDDTAAVQAAINECAAAGGGVVYFPHGVYAITQITINGQDNVQLLGTGAGSQLKWKWNAATAAGSMVTITNASHTKLEGLLFDGSGLTNPSASRNNHLLRVGDGGSTVTETHVLHCLFTNMVAASGDGVHIEGAAGELVSRLWVAENSFNGCSRYGVGGEQGFEYLWVVQNLFTACETDIAIIASSDVNVNAVCVYGNEINHTGTERRALRFEGPATQLITRLVVDSNVILNGFATLTNAQYAVHSGNVLASGVYASTDAAWRIFGAVSYLVFTNNIVDRSAGAGAGAGPCMKIEKATTSPSVLRVGGCIFVNEVAGSNFLTVVDATKWSVGRCISYAVNAGSSTMDGFDLQAVTVAMTDVMVGPGNDFSAGAGSLRSAVRLGVNGANMTNLSVVGNFGSTMDYGVRLEDLGGGGTFNGQLMIANNNFDASLGGIQQVGVTVRPRIGFNASSTGPQLFQGTGSPEGVVTAGIGSVYLRTDGGQGSSVYIKETTGNTGWIGLGGSPILFGAGDLGTTASALYLANGWIALATATEVQIAITRAGTLRNLRVQVGTAGTDAQPVTFTVRKNGVATALVATISNDASGPTSDLVDSVTVAAGDLISLQVTKGGAVTAGQENVTASLELA